MATPAAPSTPARWGRQRDMGRPGSTTVSTERAAAPESTAGDSHNGDPGPNASSRQATGQPSRVTRSRDRNVPGSSGSNEISSTQSSRALAASCTVPSVRWSQPPAATPGASRQVSMASLSTTTLKLVDEQPAAACETPDDRISAQVPTPTSTLIERVPGVSTAGPLSLAPQLAGSKEYPSVACAEVMIGSPPIPARKWRVATRSLTGSPPGRRKSSSRGGHCRSRGPTSRVSRRERPPGQSRVLLGQELEDWRRGRRHPRQGQAAHLGGLL